MIKYIKEDNKIYAYFGGITNNQDACYYWSHDLLRYFGKRSKNLSAYRIKEIIRDTLSEYEESGMKFYGETKCHPEDKYAGAVGCYIAKKRLLNKYLRVRARIADRVMKLALNAVHKLSRVAMEDRKS